MRGQVRTVAGDIAPNDLGIVLSHEHLIAHPPADVTDPDLRIDDEEAAGVELKAFSASGGGAIVDMTTIDYGRDALALARLSKRSGVHVVAATGFNKAKFAERISSRFADDRIIEWMVREIEIGMLPQGIVDLDDEAQGLRVRAGVIKAASSLNGATSDEKRVLQAAAAAHKQTGAPISTHTDKGTWAIEQADYLIGLGVRPDRILVGHLDLNPDALYHRELLARGVNIGIDQIGKYKYLSDDRRVELIASAASEGHLGQLYLSGDIARRSGSVASGGVGLSHIPTTFAARLRVAGFASDEIDRLLRENPSRLLAFG